jgi:hypothetical protein
MLQCLATTTEPPLRGLLAGNQVMPGSKKKPRELVDSQLQSGGGDSMGRSWRDGSRDVHTACWSTKLYTP